MEGAALQRNNHHSILDHGTLMVNIMASPGAGKTTTLLRTVEALKGKYSIGVMEADIDATVDAEKMDAAGVKTIQVHTGGECTMNAEMTRQALEAFDTSDIDLLFLETSATSCAPRRRTPALISKWRYFLCRRATTSRSNIR